MNINFKAAGLELTEAITGYATKKIGAVEKYLTENNSSAIFHVELARTTHHHKNGEVYKAEVKAVGGGLNLYVEAEAEDLYAAIDIVEKELIQEFIHVKGRRAKLLRRGQRVVKAMMKGLTFTRGKRLDK